MKFSKSRKEYYINAQLNRSLYGTLLGVLRFWEDLSYYLTSLGFKRNPYDWCVMNREIEGTKETVLFYLDDIKLSHVNEEVLLNTVKVLTARYGKLKDLTVTRGDVHDFLGVGRVSWRSCICEFPNKIDHQVRHVDGDTSIMILC